MLFWSLPEIFARAYTDMWLQVLQPQRAQHPHDRGDHADHDDTGPR